MTINPDKLLEINPDKLFREHSVAELKNVQKEIQVEIEKKREELRTTVGERYRDLLKAADTIRDMRETAQTVLTCISDVTSLCQALQEKHLIGFKNSDTASSINRKQCSSEDISTVLEIRILFTIPERIWTAIDEKQFTLAAELFLLSAHTHLGLQVSRAGEKYPIVASQWNTVSACRQTILDGSRRELNNATLPTVDCSNCLTSILLLEPKSLNEVLGDYLDLRREAFQQVLKADENPTVKDKLHAAVLSVHHTILVACLCFLDGKQKKGLIELDILELVGENALPTLSKFPPISPLAGQHLSHLVKAFKPSTLRPINSLPASDVRSALKDWIKKIKESLEAEMPNLLGLVGNLRGVVGVRDRVSGVAVPSDWNAVEEVMGPCHVYAELIEPHVAARTLQLVAAVWRKAIEATHEALAAIDEEFTKDGKEGGNLSENNLRWFLWKENENDEVAQQTRGCTPRVALLCHTLDSHLHALLGDVTTFLVDVKEKAPLLDFLNSCSFEAVQSFNKRLIASVSGKAPCESSIIVRARLLQAMTSQCPNLKKCLRQSDTKANGGGRTWLEMVAALCVASEEIWRSWKQFVTPNFQSLVKEKLDVDVSVSSFLLSRPASEVVTITEEAEDNTAVTSQLRVPSQPSFTLQELLLQVCLRLNAVAVHTLPRVVHLEIIEVVVNLILEHYDTLSASDTIYQSHAWQFLLDVRFLTLLLVPRDSQTLSQTVCARLEGLIDPFDLNVCYPYLQANVSKSAIRLQGTFGILVDHREKLAVLNSLKVAAGPQPGSTPEDPNVLVLSAGVPWFPLLPISSGSTRKKEESPSKQGKHRGKEAKKESTSTDFVKSAGAFFGAMTGGWS